MYRGMSWEAMRVRSIHLRETEITDMAAKHFETFRQPETHKYIAAKHIQTFCQPERHKYMAANHCNALSRPKVQRVFYFFYALYSHLNTQE